MSSIIKGCSGVVIAWVSALPIKVGNEAIGLVGVSSFPGGEQNEACAKAG